MAIFRPGVRQGALQASRQGDLGGYLAQHPNAQNQWNRAAVARQDMPQQGRQGMLGTRNANAMMNGPTLGQAAGGRPQPIAGRRPKQGGGRGGGGGGGGRGQTPGPPTAQPQAPGAQYRQSDPQYTPTTQTMGMVGGNMYGQGPGAGYGMDSFMGGRGTPGGDQLSPYGMQQFNQQGGFQQGGSGGGYSDPRMREMGGQMGSMGGGYGGGQMGGGQGGYGDPSMRDTGTMYPGQSGYPGGGQGGYGGGGYGGSQQALQGLMGQVNPGMQSVIQNRLMQNPMQPGGGGTGLQRQTMAGGSGMGGFGLGGFGQRANQYGQGANYGNPYG